MYKWIYANLNCSSLCLFEKNGRDEQQQQQQQQSEQWQYKKYYKHNKDDYVDVDGTHCCHKDGEEE